MTSASPVPPRPPRGPAGSAGSPTAAPAAASATPVKRPREKTTGGGLQALGVHWRVVRETLLRFWREPVAHLLTAFVIGVTLALPATLQALVTNARQVGYSWEGTLQASLFLRDSVSEADGRALAERLKSKAGVSATHYISRAEALTEFQAHSGFSEALAVVGQNPLPAVVVVSADPSVPKEQTKELFSSLGGLPEVEQANLDQGWLERLYAIIAVVERGIWLLAVLLGVAVVVVVGNTIRLDIENRREEIRVQKFIGAADGFIRRPFLYTGVFYGLLGGLIAYGLVQLSLFTLRGPARDLSALYASQYEIHGPGVLPTLVIFVASLGLGWLGSFVSVTRHIAHIEPV